MAATIPIMIPRRTCDVFKHRNNVSGILCYILKCNGSGSQMSNVRQHHVALSLTKNVNCIRYRPTDMKSMVMQRLKKNNRGLLSISGLRLASTTSAGINDNPNQQTIGTEFSPVNSNPIYEPFTPSHELFSSINIDPIPEPPTPLIEEVVETLQTIGEPTFISQGLGGWSPVGMVQQCMEFLHIGCDLPWWTTIIIGTIVVRTVIFPLVIVAQRNAAKMNNHLPQLQVLQMKMTEARQSGNQLDAARYGQEMMLFMKEKNLNPLKNMLVPLAQAPLFISFFMGLRGMSNVPVDSMRTGGLFWFEDLTLPDQYFLLPIITSATMWLTIEVGTDSARLSAANMQMMKYVLRALPVIILPFTVSFPGAILCYWVSTNFISLMQVGVLRIPRVREYFNIEQLVTHSPDSLPVKPKGFVKGMKESWTNLKITKEIEERQRFDEMAFQRAGKGPIQKTYKYDPTQPREPPTQRPSSSSSSIVAKKRD